MNNVIAVVLGGGAGTRLFPLTQQRAKPAVPLAGKYRLIDIPLSNCINSQIDRVFVLTQFNSASLNRHIARAYRFDRFRSGSVNILAAEQTPSSGDWFQGTADAVRQCLIHLHTFKYDYVLILSGDQLYTMDYRKMVAAHREHGADISIATIPVTADEAPEFGILKTDSREEVTEFYEKPARDHLDDKESPVGESFRRDGRKYLASMGIYVFNRGVMGALLDGSPTSHDFGKQIIPSAIGRRRIVSFPFDGYWSDIGTIRSFYDANLMLAQDEPPFDMFSPQSPLYTNARMLSPAKVQNATISSSMIAEACVITESEISNSVIGIRSYIGPGTVVNRCVFMGADYYPWHEPGDRGSIDGPERPGIGAGSRVENAIVDRNASIGENCTIVNEKDLQDHDGDGYYIRDGLVVIPKNAVIPDGTRI